MPMTKKEANELNAAKAAVRESWIHACSHDGVAQHEKFVVFSNDNPFAIKHNNRMLAFMKLRNRITKNIARRDRHATLVSLGLKRVTGSLGGVYYE
jgi:hypothetical protein